MANGYGFTYRGRHCSEFGVNLLSYTVHTPDIREYEDQVDGIAGVIDYGSEWGKRPIDVKIDIDPNDAQFKVRQSQILTWLKPTLAAGVLIFDDVPDRLYYAKLSGRLTPEQFGKYGVLDFSFKCTDPFAYGQESIFETTLTASPSLITILSEGSEATPPVIELTNTSSTQTVSGITIINEYKIE
ncbi:distal tail protein Dit [Paenibacillus daejeonensis]|uniref:distal tail protein Dit n=1 Tax=Paenibacillus daejeonensis TaxID=135193 RepID=UPI00037D5231|nr:distal tail protein Dit [Paenibacillus daejeonensis]